MQNLLCLSQLGFDFFWLVLEYLGVESLEGCINSIEAVYVRVGNGDELPVCLAEFVESPQIRFLRFRRVVCF